MKLIDGKAIANQIKNELAIEVKKMTSENVRPPHLAAVLVGEDPASQTYVRSKERSCKDVGFTSSIYRLAAKTKERELLDLVAFLNKDNEIDGFIVQLPLPDHIDVDKVINAVDPSKDVDGFHPENIGKMVTGQACFLPATPHGIMQILERTGIETEGKHCVVVGRSNIVGTPVSILMSRKQKPGNATVTLCHSKTKNLEEICKSADIIIAAIGIPEFIKENMVKKNAVVIDVGIHRMPSTETKSGYKLVGDVDFKNVAKHCSYITPVPGGVGPMTIASLLMNTLKAARKVL